MDFRNLKAFLYVAELDSFTRAGKVLGYSQSAISSQVKQLELELGARLLERVGHTVCLTDKGREVLQYANQILRLTQEMEDALKDDNPVAGHIRLAMADSLCPAFFNGDFTCFRKSYPDITLKIIIAGTEEMFRLLNHNEADMVYTLDNHIYHAAYVIAQEERIPAHFIACAGHPLAGQAALPVQALLEYPFILTEKGMSYRRLIDEKLASQSLEMTPVLELGNTGQICRLVSQGAGLSFLPDYATHDAVQAGQVCRLDVAGFDVEIWLQLLYRRGKWVSPAMNQVIAYCREATALFLE
jgi:DNA-binding transcriptional LysR family regulator